MQDFTRPVRVAFGFYAITPARRSVDRVIERGTVIFRTFVHEYDPRNREAATLRQGGT